MTTMTKTRTTTPNRNGQGGTDDGKNRPVHEERIGRICGAVWEHADGNGKVWYNVTLSRIYKDQNGNWQRSDSFGKGDIPLLIKVADRCHDWLYDSSKDESE